MAHQHPSLFLFKHWLDIYFDKNENIEDLGIFCSIYFQIYLWILIKYTRFGLLSKYGNMLLSPCDEASDSSNCDQSTYDDSWILVKEVTHFQELMSHSKIYVSK